MISGCIGPELNGNANRRADTGVKLVNPWLLLYLILASDRVKVTMNYFITNLHLHAYSKLDQTEYETKENSLYLLQNQNLN